MARGQVSSQVATVILAVLLIAGISIVGMKWLGALSARGKTQALLGFQKQLTEDAAAAAAKHDRFSREQYPLPGVVERVCLVDNERRQEIQDSIAALNEPLLLDAVRTSADDSVFLFSDELERAFPLPKLSIPAYPHFACVRSEGAVELGLRGSQGKALLVTDLIASVKLAGVAATLHSSDGLMRLEVAAGSFLPPAGEDTLSVSILPGSGGQASDSYRLSPAGARFSPPAMLVIAYPPQLVGDCPASLTFTYTYDDGSSQDFASVQVDCVSHEAAFLIDAI
ncbi:hypothetical protein J4439_00895 [Candidatus Woesearchaeota archaeon]|nr:hypothetical protein [Candidatus Woesearchaeota archaeon]